MILNGSIQDYEEEHFPSFKFSTNCYWIEIEDKKGNVIFSRKPAGDDSHLWLDDKHRPITEALNALEKALLAAIR